MKKASLIYSSREQLAGIARILSGYVRLPLSVDNIPGALMEALLAHIRGGKALKKYDFVDVIKPEAKCGWQVKSTKESTPVTWKRAKIPNSAQLIAASKKSPAGCQALGKAIIEFCNHHAQASLSAYDLDVIGYCRLIVHKNRKVTYFERVLCTREQPELFHAADFTWKWSEQKRAKKKEQLPALHGTHRRTGVKWFAWHGQGENQLHFNGERIWWPKPSDPHAVTFKFPAVGERLGFDQFMELLDRLPA